MACSTWRRNGNSIRLMRISTKEWHQERDRVKEPSVQQKPLTAGIVSGHEETFDNYIGGKRQTKEFTTS